MKRGNGRLSEGKKRAAEKVLHRVLLDVKPTPNEIELLNERSNELMGRLKDEAPRNVDILLVGSVARGTQIRGTSDIDIFLLFPKTMDERRMEAEGLKIAKRVIKKGGERFEIKYAEHPYTRMFLKGIAATADIVPAFKISNAEEMGSAVDRTQLHNKFVNSKLSQKQRNDVRLLKAFLDARSVYGAEARIEGFSGYLCELLVYYYNSFIGVLERMAELKLPLAIDILNKGSEKHNVSEVVKRFNSDFVVIDPTDRNRNVAANVSLGSIAKAALAARTFLDKPSVNTFYTEGYSDSWATGLLRKLKSLDMEVLLVSFRLPDMTEDILWQQLKRLGERMAHELRQHGFPPIQSLQNIRGQDAIVAFVLERREKRADVIAGPSAIMSGASEAFLKSHDRHYAMFLDNDRIISIENSKYATAGDVLRRIISQNNIKFPSYINKKGARLYSGRMPVRYQALLKEALEDKAVH